MSELYNATFYTVDGSTFDLNGVEKAALETIRSCIGDDTAVLHTILPDDVKVTLTLAYRHVVAVRFTLQEEGGE